MLTKDEINSVLSDMKKIIPYTLQRKEHNDWVVVETYNDPNEVWLDILDSGKPKVRLDTLFNCRAEPYNTLVNMVSDACRVKNRTVDGWFIDKYSVKKEFQFFGDNHHFAVSRIQSLAEEISRVCIRHEIDETEYKRLQVLECEMKLTFAQLHSIIYL
jgi:hypothetical protein